MFEAAFVAACLIVGVADGDTLRARCGAPGAYEEVRVRLAGIDAPERRQPFGERARQTLAGMAFGKVAELDCPKRDRYGRAVCTVRVPGAGGAPTDAGLAMVQQGMAWWYRAYAHEQPTAERAAYSDAEAKAQRQRLGLWADDAPTPPWEWRRR